MLTAIVKFYCGLLWNFFLPAWVTHSKPDPNHFHWRRFTRKYSLKKRVVWHLWGLVAASILFFPVIAFVSFICPFALFLSFAILDETA